MFAKIEISGVIEVMTGLHIGGSSNQHGKTTQVSGNIEIRYAPGGDENENIVSACVIIICIEIRYAPGGDENL